MRFLLTDSSIDAPFHTFAWIGHWENIPVSAPLQAANSIRNVIALIDAPVVNKVQAH